MSTPFDIWLAAQQTQKQAVDALVPGQVGAGANPGTTGQLDSPDQDATNSQIGAQRQAQGAAPILANPNADGGAGYSHPPTATSPSMQMFADVKAATIEKEARAFAFETYEGIKAAHAQGQIPTPPQPAPAQKQAADADPIAFWAEQGRAWARAGK